MLPSLSRTATLGCRALARRGQLAQAPRLVIRAAPQPRHQPSSSQAIPHFTYSESGASALWLRLKFLEYSLAAKQKIGYTEGEADIIKKMASVRGEMGDMEAAKQLLEAALQMQREMYKTEHHSEIADTVSRLVGALGLTGQHREATTMLEKLLDIQKGIAGGNEQNVDVVCTMRDVARGKGSLGDHAEMVRILKRVVEIQTTMHGTENHREVIKTLLLLASAHAAMKDREALGEVMEKVVEHHSARWKGWGDKLLSFPIIHLKARVAGEMGDVASKRRLLETLLDRQQQEYGSMGALDVIDVMIDLADVMVTLGEKEGAKTLVNRAMQMKENLGVPDIMWASTGVKLAGVYGAMGDLKRKKALLEDVLKVQTEYMGSNNHEQIVITKLELAEMAHQMDDKPREAELRQEIASIRDSLEKQGTVCKAGLDSDTSRLVLLAIAIESFSDIYF